MRRTRPVLALIAALLVALGVAGCFGGGGSGSSGGGIASVVPADAGAYVDFAARPDAPGASSLSSAVAKITGRPIDLGGKLAQASDQKLSTSNTGLTYDKDIKPVLGDRAGGFVSASATGTPDGALVVEVTDGGKAIDTISKLIESSGTTKLTDHTYKGVDFKTDGHGSLGIVDGKLVVGTQHGFEAAVDASKGSSLADSKEFQGAVGNKASLATAYATPTGIIDLLARSSQLPAAQLDAARKQLGAQANKPVVVSASIDSHGFRIEGSGAARGPAPKAALDDLPAQSWAAFGVAGVGGALKQAFNQAQAASPLNLNDALLHRTGFDINADVLSWLGDFSAFLGGSSIIDLKLGAVLGSTDPRASAQALDRLKILASGNLPPDRAKVGKLGVKGDAGFTVTFPKFPAPLNVVQRGGKVVIALGDQTTEDAFSTAGTGLGASSAFVRAKQALGAGFVPVLYLGFPAMDKFLESLPNAQSDPRVAPALPYLKRLDFFALGTKHEGDRASFSAVLGLP